MTIDGCKHTFRHIAGKILPAHMKRMRKAISHSRNLGEFGVTGDGTKTILMRLDKPADFSGCYVLLKGRTPVYVGISRFVVSRLLGHVKGRDHYTATLAYRMARAGNPEIQTRKDAMKDNDFMRLFEAKKKSLKKHDVAFIEIDDVIEMYLFEVYCAMKLDTRWNSFQTH